MRKIVFTVIFSLISNLTQAETIHATVNGLVCSFCATGIGKTFKKQAAVEQVKIDLENKLVIIGTKSGQSLDDATITKLINNAGYSIVAIKREP